MSLQLFWVQEQKENLTWKSLLTEDKNNFYALQHTSCFHLFNNYELDYYPVSQMMDFRDAKVLLKVR